ncbi:MAG: hypothetical protein Q8N77_01935 [Nanoarchaeota archaeon]|nr:hypothetical protein [Nanoarchaeota archaeon]
MKIPQVFLPNNSLEGKVEHFLKLDNSGKVIEQPVDDGKRKILLYFRKTISLPADGIYVKVRHPRSETGCFLEVRSESQFYAPPSDYNWSASENAKGKVKAYLTSDRAMFKYLKSLIRRNNGVLLWGDDEHLLCLKNRKDEYERLYIV